MRMPCLAMCLPAMLLPSMLLPVLAAAMARKPHENTIEIAPGVFMPLVGLGTWQYNASVAQQAVSQALALGYPLIDHALGYKNGEGVGRAIAGSTRPRSSYFVATKIPGGLSYKDAAAALESVLQELGLDYVDLVSTHYPAAWDKTAGGSAARRDEWRALEDFHRAGKARSIGVSHYCPRHLTDLLDDPSVTIKPAANQVCEGEDREETERLPRPPRALTPRPCSVRVQVEFHIGMGSGGVNSTDGLKFMREKGVAFLSFSTLCGPCGADAHEELINGPLVSQIGAKYKKSGAQVSLKWAVQQGIPVVPKSANPTHLKENLDLFGWSLTKEEMATLSAATSPPVTGGGDGHTSGDCGIP